MTSNARQEGRISIERTVWGSIEDVWDLWTTKDGLESWWGPEGFTTTVTKLEVRPGGVWEYVMTATSEEKIAAMKAMGAPLSMPQAATYTEVEARERLAYQQTDDFDPDAAPYDFLVTVELRPEGNRVRMTLITDPLRTAEGTQGAVYGYNSAFDRLERVLEARRAGAGKA